MKSRVKSFLKFLIFLSIGVFLIWFSVHKLDDKDIASIKEAFNHAQYGWVIAATLAGVLSHYSRAVRWKMLMQPLGYKPSTRNTFFAVMVGYLANYVINRLGEVTRCGVLTKYEKVRFDESFGTVIVERLADVICFLILAAIVFLIQSEMIFTYLKDHIYPSVVEKFSAPGIIFYAVVSTVSIILFILVFYWKKIKSHLGKRTEKIISGFTKGLSTISKLKNPWLFVAHSIFIWAVYYITFHICFFSLPQAAHISVGVGLTVFMIATLTIMITPGGLGAFPIAVASVLSLYNIDYGIGIALGWLVWLTQFVCILLFGGASLVLLPLLNSQAANDQSTSDNLQ